MATDPTKLDNVGTLRHTVLLAIIWSCFGGALLIGTGRTAVRLKIVKRPSAEDYWILFALAALLSLCVLETIQLPSLYYMTAVVEGTLLPSLDLIGHTETYLRYQFPITVLYWTVLWSIKAGFLALYFKLFKELPIYRRVWYGLAFFTLLAYAACWASLAVSCGTLSNFFKFNQCGSEQQIWMSNFNVYLSTSVDVFTDLCIMAMPLRLIYNVRVSTGQKIGLIAVFGLGFVMIAFSIIRANQILVPKMFVNLSMLMLWSTLAATISVIVGSLPAFKVFIANRTATRRARGTNGSSSANSRQLHHGGSFGTGGVRGSGGGASANYMPSGKGVPLGSISSYKSAAARYGKEGGLSTDEILKPTSSAGESPRLGTASGGGNGGIHGATSGGFEGVERSYSITGGYRNNNYNNGSAGTRPPPPAYGRAF
ncbi:uncharacterized protein B0I36DRAFT_242354 [Microdochium trichocladiopsis]|uniref:Rhodopsin domain-containing protein n=1 Tax=Microdochium trichocladiopsis TaxID=1682393 RepID=A0A9P8Y5G7_9PEZI|nr:uncharacterized protein B0I36DRAFT_242354 [Microdochium trichocladiopsis]KAH7030639.1 hypothetical protein B0I36DRAFT_242354 [Microdochium trichocladiopsis]